MKALFKLPNTPPVLQTKDLILAPIKQTHLDSYFGLCSNEAVMAGWGTSSHTCKKETADLIDFLQQELEMGNMIRWGIFLSQDPMNIIGDVGFWRFVPVRLRGELGGKLLPQYWNKSFMTQALNAVIAYGFQSLFLNSVEGNIEPDNIGSIKLVESLGFVKEGYIAQHTFHRGKDAFVDTHLYSLVKDMWAESTVSA